MITRTCILAAENTCRFRKTAQIRAQRHSFLAFSCHTQPPKLVLTSYLLAVTPFFSSSSSTMKTTPTTYLAVAALAFLCAATLVSAASLRFVRGDTRASSLQLARLLTEGGNCPTGPATVGQGCGGGLDCQSGACASNGPTSGTCSNSCIADGSTVPVSDSCSCCSGSASGSGEFGSTCNAA